MLECGQTLFLLLSERCTIHTLPLIYLLVQLPSALGSLPAPVNLNVKSLNLHHVLHWEPGPGSPTGTQFWIFKGVLGGNLRQVPRPTTSTSSKLKLQIMSKYELAVQASYNNTRSPLSDKITFEPLYSTIGPPLLSLAGCGSCIQINISLPDKIQRQYDSSFRVQWRKGKDGEIQELEKREKSFYLKNLEKDVEYCVQVDIKTRVNKNTLPSGWNCTFTSISEPKTGMLVLVIVTALLILLLIVLTMGIFCLYYTGFLCKLKEMPTALMFVLWPDYVLTPNNMVLNQVTIISQPVKSRNCPTMSHPSNGASNSEDEDGEEEDAANLYMDRNAELSSGRGSHQDSANTSVNLGEDVRMDSGSFTEKQPAVLEEQQVESGHCEAEAVQVSFMHDGNQSGPQVRVMVQEEEMKTGTQDVSGDVNLFSVTFASLATCDEGEIEEEDDSENSSTDFLRIYTLKPLSQMDSQCEQDDPVSAPLMHPSEENFIESGYDGKRADSWMDYEEEEELSGYLTHK